MDSKISALLFEYESSEIFEEPNLTGTPERNLLMAILERAILDYVGNDLKERESAERWLFDDLDMVPYSQFSFPWICQQLDLDIPRIVGKIKKMPKRGNNRMAPWYFKEDYFKEAG